MVLTVSLGMADRDDARPLTGLEWHRLDLALRDRGTEPGALLNGDLSDLLSGWADREVTLPRLEGLLGRGLALGVALERWERAGLWAITGSDRDYPARLRERLGGKRPPVLFGCGDRGRLAAGGVAVVGSREADSDDLQFAEDMGVAAAGEGCGVVSGGAKGVDRRAMLGALERGGSVVGVLANGLLGAASSARYRDFLLSGNLTLISPSNPESGFGVGKAMGRNRCIYCLADSAVVVSSTFGKGGTWTGATECLKARWVPVWVRDRDGMSPGNAELLKRGAKRLSRHMRSIAELGSLELQAQPHLAGIAEAHHADSPELQAEPAQLTGLNGPSDLGGRDPAAPGPELQGVDPASAILPTPPVHRTDSDMESQPPGQACGGTRSQPDATDHLGFFDLFLRRFSHMAREDALLTAQDIAAQMPELEESQVRKWLRRGASEDVIERVGRPARYRPKRTGLL